MILDSTDAPWLAEYANEDKLAIVDIADGMCLVRHTTMMTLYGVEAGEVALASLGARIDNGGLPRRSVPGLSPVGTISQALWFARRLDLGRRYDAAERRVGVAETVSQWIFAGGELFEPREGVTATAVEAAQAELEDSHAHRRAIIAEIRVAVDAAIGKIEAATSFDTLAILAEGRML